MPDSSDVDTERVGARVYLPRYQKQQWKDEADDNDLSLSEYIRLMVQAGRQSPVFDHDHTTSTDTAADAPAPSSGEFREQVLRLLDTGEFTSWGDLQQTLTDHVETELDAALTELQEEGRVRYSGRHDGYTLTD
jgi:hypothetical protein